MNLDSGTSDDASDDDIQRNPGASPIILAKNKNKAQEHGFFVN
jgi:hypothetical protein